MKESFFLFLYVVGWDHYSTVLDSPAGLRKTTEIDFRTEFRTELEL
jgi:hypothetical protein